MFDVNSDRTTLGAEAMLLAPAWKLARAAFGRKEAATSSEVMMTLFMRFFGD
jgi:hypothetical protein